MEALVAILAGGRGERVGGAKPSRGLAGHPLIDYPLAAAIGAKAETVVVAKPETALPALDVRVVREPAEPHHPLCGIVAGIREAERPLLAVGCDLPFVTPELIAWLADLPDPLVVPELGGSLQPLLARYDPSHLDALESALERRAALQETVRELEPRIIGEGELGRFGDPERLLFNVNTLDDLAKAERMLGR